MPISHFAMRKSKCLFYKMTAVIKLEADIIPVILIGSDVMLVMVNVQTTKPNVFVFIDSHNVFDVTLTDNFTVSWSVI